MDHKKFIAVCRKIARTKGTLNCREAKREAVAGHIAHDDTDKALVFKDNMIKIVVMPNSPAISITRLYNDNPIVVVDNNGNIIRWHGEASYLVDYVRSLLKVDKS